MSNIGLGGLVNIEAKVVEPIVKICGVKVNPCLSKIFMIFQWDP